MWPLCGQSAQGAQEQVGNSNLSAPALAPSASVGLTNNETTCIHTYETYTNFLQMPLIYKMCKIVELHSLEYRFIRLSASFKVANERVEIGNLL